MIKEDELHDCIYTKLWRRPVYREGKRIAVARAGVRDTGGDCLARSTRGPSGVPYLEGDGSYMECTFVKAPRTVRLKWVILFYVNFTLTELIRNKQIFNGSNAQSKRPSYGQPALTPPVYSYLSCLLLSSCPYSLRPSCLERATPAPASAPLHLIFPLPASCPFSQTSARLTPSLPPSLPSNVTFSGKLSWSDSHLPALPEHACSQVWACASCMHVCARTHTPFSSQTEDLV